MFGAGSATAADALRAGALPALSQFAELLYLTIAVPAVTRCIPLLQRDVIDNVIVVDKVSVLPLAIGLLGWYAWYETDSKFWLYDIYFFDKSEPVDPEMFTDIIGRHFRQPPEGLGFDGSGVAHMWRSAIWPNNAL